MYVNLFLVFQEFLQKLSTNVRVSASKSVMVCVYSYIAMFITILNGRNLQGKLWLSHFHISDNHTFAENTNLNTFILL